MTERAREGAEAYIRSLQEEVASLRAQLKQTQESFLDANLETALLRRELKQTQESLQNAARQARASQAPARPGRAQQDSSAVVRALKDAGWPGLAFDIKNGISLEEALSRLRDIGEADSEAADIIRQWL